LAELLVGFFDYFASFDFDRVISVRLGDCVQVNDPRLLQPGHDSLKDKNIRIEEPFDGTNTARAVYRVTDFVKIQITIRHVAKELKRAQEAGADLFKILETDIIPDKKEIEKLTEEYTEEKRKKFAQSETESYYNIGGSHIIIDDSSEEEKDDSSEFTTTDQFQYVSDSDSESDTESEKDSES
jgi:hypothetical protein